MWKKIQKTTTCKGSKHSRGSTFKYFSQTPEVWGVRQVVHKACGRSQYKKTKHSIRVQIRFVAVKVQMQNKLQNADSHIVGFFFLIRECNSIEEVAEQMDKIE